MDTNEIDNVTPNFGVQVAKSFTISAAASAGTVVGFVAIGAVVGKISKIRSAKKAKKSATDK